MACHRVAVAGIQIIDADAIAAVVAARTMEVTAATQMQTHMGAAPWGAEENQIAGLQQARFPNPHGHRPAKALLEVGIAGKPDAGGGMGGLNQPGTVEIRAQGAPPEVVVGPLTGLFGKGQHRWQPGGDGDAIQAGKTRESGGHGHRSKFVALQPTGVAILQQANPQTRASAVQHPQMATRRHLGGQAGSPGSAVGIEGVLQAPKGARGEGVGHRAA